MRTVKQILEELRDDIEWENANEFLRESTLDSLDMIQLVTELDKTFSISIDAVDITPDNFRNIQTISALVDRHQMKNKLNE